MQAVVCSSCSAIKAVSVTRSAPVVCQHNVAKRAAAAAVTMPAMLVASPAMALVDQRLGGEGTGKILGVGGPEGIAIVVVFGLIWALFSAGAKVLGEGRGSGDDSGLSL